ncbi:CRISPR-associated protein Cas4 [Rummeliibacillus sp. SL167]|uniref:CRISPR-associated protein Cas4 n=1 Tax=Rummeliibacillus sp. SL167 TaxID=2579792 RepID=UPI0011B5E08A|nr:CRISPR-associated protein Cas4 [Rummeliibacillus sp. SL167]
MVRRFDEMRATGLQVQYLKVCKRKLWLYSHQINFEDESDTVLQGKILHENSYKNAKTKELLIDDLVKIDIVDSQYIGEVKSSSKMRNSDVAQLLYYLYVLKKMGIERKGKLHYPKEKKTEEIELTTEMEEEIPKWLAEIQQILSLDKPPVKVKYPYCKKCSYYSFCWVGEE